MKKNEFDRHLQVQWLKFLIKSYGQPDFLLKNWASLYLKQINKSCIMAGQENLLWKLWIKKA